MLNSLTDHPQFDRAPSRLLPLARNCAEAVNWIALSKGWPDHTLRAILSQIQPWSGKASIDAALLPRTPSTLCAILALLGGPYRNIIAALGKVSFLGFPIANTGAATKQVGYA